MHNGSRLPSQLHHLQPSSSPGSPQYSEVALWGQIPIPASASSLQQLLRLQAVVGVVAHRPEAVEEVQNPLVEGEVAGGDPMTEEEEEEVVVSCRSCWLRIWHSYGSCN